MTFLLVTKASVEILQIVTITLELNFLYSTIATTRGVPMFELSYN